MTRISEHPLLPAAALPSQQTMHRCEWYLVEECRLALPRPSRPTQGKSLLCASVFMSTQWQGKTSSPHRSLWSILKKRTGATESLTV